MHLPLQALFRDICDAKSAKKPSPAPFIDPAAATQARQPNGRSFGVSKAVRPAAPRFTGAQGCTALARAQMVPLHVSNSYMWHWGNLSLCLLLRKHAACL